MIQVKMNSRGAFDRDSLLSLNRPSKKTAQDLPRQPAQTQKEETAPFGPKGVSAKGGLPSSGSNVNTREGNLALGKAWQVPPLTKTVKKGQKVSLETSGKLRKIRACFGWNSVNGLCDVDVSAFLLGADGRVLGDSWFVFYGQKNSPDQSTVLKMDGGTDREVIALDFERLNPAVEKIVFVLTIHEALERRLHFGMLKDAYVRILDGEHAAELVSFPMSDYYTNVISMMIGEIYRYQGSWKFHAVGNGVARDLAGLCELYGVSVSD